MPKEKVKKRVAKDSDTSDSGPEPEDVSLKKKMKVDNSGNSSDIESWHLEGMRFVKVRKFRGKAMVDIREFYESNGELLPGKKGICLSLSQWRKFASLVSEIDDVVKKQ